MAPFGETRLHGVFEVGVLSLGACIGMEVERGGGGRQTLVFALVKMMVFYHQRHHDVSPLMAVLGVDERVVEGRGFQNTHQNGCLVGGEFRRGGVEVGLARCLDAIAVAAEIHGVGIHGENIFLVVNQLNLGGDNPFLAFHDEHAQDGQVA